MGAAALATAGAASADAATSGGSGPQASSVFRHSVASGDPLPDRVILWTRVTPDDAAVPGSGTGRPTAVHWEVSTSPQFAAIVSSGDYVTSPDRDHTVKVDATGLRPASRYFYRFTIADGPHKGVTSVTGRTKTAPPADTDNDLLKFAVCSCSNYETGFFNAYRAMADRDDIDFVLHLGDYTYEYASGEYLGKYLEIVRRVQPLKNTVTLKDYRIRQGKHHEDPDLARCHALHPWVCMWDDHETADNSYDGGAEDHFPEFQGSWADRKRAADEAYFEWMPVRPNSIDGGEHLYRRFTFGKLVDLVVPDLRSYRSKQTYIGTDTPEQTITGNAQLDWLRTSLTTSKTRWQVVGNEVMIVPLVVPWVINPDLVDFLHSKFDYIPRDGLLVDNDQWDGYADERHELLSAIDAAGKKSVVFVTGDIHSSWVSEIPLNTVHYGKNAKGRVVACEFTPPSITAPSGYDEIALNEAAASVCADAVSVAQSAIKAADPWIKDVELTSHGFGILGVTPERATMEWYFVEDIQDPQSRVSLAKRWYTEHGKPKVIKSL